MNRCLIARYQSQMMDFIAKKEYQEYLRVKNPHRKSFPKHKFVILTYTPMLPDYCGKRIWACRRAMMRCAFRRTVELDVKHSMRIEGYRNVGSRERVQG